MGVNVNVYNFRCFNQLRNGVDFDQNLEDFTPNLVGNVGEKVKVVYSADVTQSSFTEGAQEWVFIEVDPGIFEVTRSSGSFLEDAVQIGDQFYYYDNWENRKTAEDEVFRGEVLFLSNQGQTLRFSVESGSFTAGTFQNVGFSFDQSVLLANENDAYFIKFGLIGNNETFNFLSKTTGNQQIFYRANVPKSSNFFSQAESLGVIKDWVSGKAGIGYRTTSNDFGAATYEIEHEFIINPFYILAYRQFIENGTIPEPLAGDNSLKYAVELEFRKTLSDTSSSKVGVFDNLNGFIGWYGENFNGLNADYRVKSVEYEDFATGDPFEGVNINAKTKITITVEDPDASITDYSCGVYLIRVPQSEKEYIGTKTDLVTNFLYKSAIVSSPATSDTDISTSIVSGDLVIEFDVEYTVEERLRLSEDDEFLLLVQVEDPSGEAGNSDRLMMLGDFKNYVDIDFLADFVNVPEYGFLTHGQELGVASPSPEKNLSNEDGILLQATFETDTQKNVVIDGASVALIAFKPSTNESFELDRYDFNIGGFVQVGSVQQIEVETVRGYALPPGDQFNIARITTEGLNLGFQQYGLVIGQKITWQDWISNPEADPVFFNAGKPNNNLNEKASNYSEKEGYEIRLATILRVTGEDDLGRIITGDFINYGGKLIVLDYDESEDGVTGEIQTFDLETGQSLEGNILFNGKDTLFKAVFQNASGMGLAIHRIEPSRNPGGGIFELSSLLPSVSNNILKPLNGENLLKFSLSDDVLTTECLVDGSKLQENTSYKLSARTLPLSTDPLAATDLVAVATSTTEITLNWQDNNGGDPPDSYEIFRGTSSGNLSLVDTTTNLNTYSDSGLQGGTTYFYQVRAVRDGLKSNFSNEASANTFFDFKTALSAQQSNSDHVLFNQSLSGVPMFPLSFSFWLYPKTPVDSSSGEQTIFSSSIDTNNFFALSLEPFSVNSRYTFFFRNRVSGTVNNVNFSKNANDLFSNTIDVQRWLHFVATIEESPADPSKLRYKLYFESSLAGSGESGTYEEFFDIPKSTVQPNLMDESALFTLIRSGSTIFFGDFIMDDFYILDTVLDQSDVDLIYANGAGSNYIVNNLSANIVRGYKFDEADNNPNGNGGGGDNTGITAPELVDESSDNDKATLVNFNKNGSDSNWVDANIDPSLQFEGNNSAILIAELGQSNMEGRDGDLSNPDYPFDSTVGAKEYDGSNLVTLNTLRGGAVRGSHSNYFADSVFSLSSKKAVMCEAASGGAGFGADSGSSGNNHWGPTGALRPAATSLITGGLAAISASKPFAALWSGGERDAQQIDDVGSYTKADAKAAMQDIINWWQNLYPGSPFFFSRVGRPDSADTAGFQAVRELQDELVNENNNVYMAFTGAVDFPSNSKMFDELHYNFEGLQDMGEAFADSIKNNTYI